MFLLPSPLTLSLPLVVRTSPLRTPELLRDFNRADFNKINNYICSINWDDELKDLEINDAVDCVCYIIT